MHADNLFYLFYTGATGVCKGLRNSARKTKGKTKGEIKGKMKAQLGEAAASPFTATATASAAATATARAAAFPAVSAVSAVSVSTNPHDGPQPNSDECEQIGFAVSKDGMNFTVSDHNPIAVYKNSTFCR